MTFFDIEKLPAGIDVLGFAQLDHQGLLAMADVFRTLADICTVAGDPMRAERRMVDAAAEYRRLKASLPTWVLFKPYDGDAK